MTGGGFEKPTTYSYGYIARIVGHNLWEHQGKSNTRRVKRGLNHKKNEEEAELVLVEKVDNESIASTTKRLTPKKFLLVGSNKETKEVEVTGLVSLIQHGHGGINHNCKKTEEKGAIRDGSCDKVFFPARTDNSSQFATTPKFIKEELQKPDGTGVSWMRLLLKNKSLGVVWGQRKTTTSGTTGSSGNTIKWSRTGYLYLGEQSGGKVTKAEKAWTHLENQGTGKNQKVALFFVVHDLIFQNGRLKGTYKHKYETHNNIFSENTKKSSDFQTSSRDIRSGGKTKSGTLIDIHLSSDRNYYIWDPSKTKIKNGELVTGEGTKLPFNLRFDTTWSSSLIK